MVTNEFLTSLESAYAGVASAWAVSISAARRTVYYTVSAEGVSENSTEFGSVASAWRSGYAESFSSSLENDGLVVTVSEVAYSVSTNAASNAPSSAPSITPITLTYYLTTQLFQFEGVKGESTRSAFLQVFDMFAHAHHTKILDITVQNTSQPDAGVTITLKLNHPPHPSLSHKMVDPKPGGFADKYLSYLAAVYDIRDLQCTVLTSLSSSTNAELAVREGAKGDVGNMMVSCMANAHTKRDRERCAHVETRAVLESALGGAVDNTTLYEYIDKSAASSVVDQVRVLHLTVRCELCLHLQVSDCVQASVNANARKNCLKSTGRVPTHHYAI